MKKTLFALAAAVAVFSCEKKQDNAVKTTETATVEDARIEDESLGKKSCFLKVVGSDSIFVTLDDNLGTVTGKMFYKNFQKDSSFGDLVGTSNGDTIKVDYAFQSEGTLSSVEKWFLKKGDKLIEATGKFDPSGAKYADYKKLSFDGIAFENADCALVEKKLAQTNTPVVVEDEQRQAPKAAEKPEPKKEEVKKPDAKEQKKPETKPETKKTTPKADNKNAPQKAETDPDARNRKK